VIVSSASKIALTASNAAGSRGCGGVARRALRRGRRGARAGHRRRGLASRFQHQENPGLCPSAIWVEVIDDVAAESERK
jgi:hypothetical protein